MIWSNVDKAERKVILVALSVSAVHLLLIAVAVVYLKILVPTCQPNEKLFERGSLRSIAPNRIEVHYLAKMWNFEPRKIVIPLGTTVDFFLGSADVVHGFHINNTDVNLMAVPGVINKATHTFAKAGVFHVVCHEYCGMGHQNMNAEIEVSESATAPSSDLAETKAEALTASEIVGRKLYESKGCVACHSLDGKPGVGPTFKGLFGREENLEDGSTVKTDEAYIIESIKQPTLKIVKGFSPVMPAMPLTDEEIKSLVEFIETVK